MKIREAIEEGDEDGIAMAPLIDIVFLLLVFFIVTSSLSNVEREIEITLPTAQSAGDISHQSNEIIINVLRDGSYLVNQASLDNKALTIRLKELAKNKKKPNVMIRADAKAFHEYTINVLDACAKAGLTNVSFLTVSTDN